MNKKIKKIAFGILSAILIVEGLSVQASEMTGDISEEQTLDISSDEIIIDSESVNQNILRESENVMSEVESDAKSDLEIDTIPELEVLNIEEIDVSEKTSLEKEQVYRNASLPGNPKTNQIEYNQYYGFNSLQKDDDRYHGRYYFEMNFPEDGRAKIEIKDCTKSCMGTEWYHSDYNGLDSQEWVEQGTESYDSGWLTVKAGAFAFAVEPSSQINIEAQVIIRYQQKGEFVGELEENDTYDTATMMEINTPYEGNCKTQGDVDLYKFVLTQPGLVEIHLNTREGASSWFLYEEDINGNVSQIMYYAPVYYSGVPRLRLAPGNYYIKIQPWVHASEREYTVCAKVSYESADQYEQEKNNVKSQANEKKENCWYTGNLNSKSDVDNYKIVISNRGYIALEFKIPRQTERNKIEISLCNENMEILCSVLNTENPYLKTEEKIYPAGVYYVRVTAGDNYSPDKFDFYDDYSFCFNYRVAHIWNTELTIDKVATCTSKGIQSIHCSECGEIKEGSTIEIPMREHSWGAGEVTRTSTCTAIGEKAYTCIVCGTSRTEEIPMISHNWSAWKQTVAPTTKAEGQEQRACQTCGRAETRSVSKLPVVLEKVKINTPSIVSGDNIKISWQAVKYADGYEVYRNQSSKWKKVATLKGDVLEYTDTDTKIGTTYSYSIRAYAVVDNVTIQSPSAKPGVSIQQSFYKDAVKMSYAKALSTKSIKIKWSGRKKSAGYIIYRKVAGKSWKKLATVGKVNTYTDKTCKAATTYQYAVKAYAKTGGKTVYSKMEKIGAVAVSKMAKPTFTVKSAAKKTATLSWTKQSNVTGYVIYRKEGSAGTWEKIKRVSAKTSSYKDKGLKRKKTYYYIVKAYKKAIPSIGLTEPTYSGYYKKKVKIK